MAMESGDRIAISYRGATIGRAVMLQKFVAEETIIAQGLPEEVILVKLPVNLKQYLAKMDEREP